MKEVTFAVDSIRFLTDTVFELVLNAAEDLPSCEAGQFLHLKIPGQDAMLRRPFCLYRFSTRSVRLLVAVVGKGTRMLASLKRDDQVNAIVPIGNGFVPASNHKKVALIGGGVGCAPLLMVAPTHPECEVNAFLGFASDSSLRTVLQQDYEAVCPTVVATEDGSIGEKGFVTDAFFRMVQSGYRPDVIFTCGAEPMMKAVKKLSQQLGIPAFASGEVRMGCGVGACLVCTCAVKDSSGAIRHKRACVDGPVFNLEDWML